jgi:hypothetical protein
MRIRNHWLFLHQIKLMLKDYMAAKEYIIHINAPLSPNDTFVPNSTNHTYNMDDGVKGW